MAWLGDFLHRYPDLALYLALGLGYLIGGYKIKGFSLGSVTGLALCRPAHRAIGHVPVSSTAKSILFLLFLFGIGYSVGPQVFRTLRGDGYEWVILGVFTTTVGLLTAYVVARYLKLDPGFSAGLLSRRPDRIAGHRHHLRGDRRAAPAGGRAEPADRPHRRGRRSI